MHKAIAISVLVLACGMNAPAFAKKARHYRGEEPSTAQYANAHAGVCRPLCMADMTPCDPPEFKNADGRCNFGQTGGGGSFR